MAVIYLLLAILPVYFFGLFIYYKDRNREPVKLIIKLLIGGILSAFLTIILTYILYYFFPFFSLDSTKLDIGELFIYVLVGIGLIEESSKWIFAYLIGFKSKEFDETYDSVVYCVIVALGFAVFENILYVFQYGLGTALLRMVTAIPGHLSFGVMMGYFFSKAKYALVKKDMIAHKKNMLLSWIVPIMLHTIFDYLIMGQVYIGEALYLVFIIWMFSYVFKKVNKLAKENAPLITNYQNSVFNMNFINFCPNCGTKTINNKCPKCNIDLH